MADFNEIDEARKVLGLGESALLNEIRSAYRRLAQRHHPDVHGNVGEKNEEVMKKLNRAYKILMDYCTDYRYSFKEEDVAKTYPYEEYLRNWREKWYNSI